MPKSQSGFIHYLLILIMLAGIGVAVYLTQFTQVFKPYALETATLGTYGSTPICELNQPNCRHLSDFLENPSSIQTMAFLGFSYPNGSILTGPTGSTITSDGLSEAKKAYFAKELDYLWFDGGSLITNQSQSTDYSPLLNNIKDLKSLAQNNENPNFRIGIHAGSIVSLNPLFIIWPYLTESNFLHNVSGSRLAYPGQELFKFLYLQNEDTRRRLAQGFAQIMGDTPIDGLLFDSYASPHLTIEQALGTNNCKEAFNCKDPNIWFPYIRQIALDIKSALPNSTSKDIIYNGIFYSSQPNPTWDGNMNQGFLNYTDGALVEHVHSMLVSENEFKSYIEAIKSAVASGKKIFFLSQPQLFYQTHATDNPAERNPVDMTQWKSFLTDNNIPIDLNLERFYLASYLLIQKNPYTYFGYHPGFVFSGDFDVYFYEDWNKNYGEPLDEYQVTASGLYTRNYKNGFVVVNPTNQAQVFDFPDKTKNYLLWDPANGPGANNAMQILPKQGVFLFNPLSTPNQASLSPTYSSFPSSSPTLIKKLGDPDNDGDVDIRDYNTFIRDYAAGNLRSDLNGDGKVNIFDFNILVRNFGK